MFDKDNKFGFISNNSESNNNNVEGLDKVKTDLNNIKSDVDELNTQYKDIAKQTMTEEERNKLTNLNNYDDSSVKSNIQSVQQQVNNLVLGAVGDGNNAEVVQARGDYSVLNERLSIRESSIDKYIDPKYTYKWVVGFLNADGTVDTSRKFRISTNDVITAPEKLIIHGDFSKGEGNGFTWWIQFFNDDGTVKEQKQISKFKSADVEVNANDKFKISMGLYTYNGSIVYNTPYNEIFEALTITKDISLDTIEKNKNDISVLKEGINAIGNIANVNEYNANVIATAHKGYSIACPDNTMISYKKAYENGFRIFETDVKKTSDGVLVLLHDKAINNTARNTDGTELTETVNITDITYAQASQYDFGIYKGKEFKGEKIPKLEDLLLYAKKRNCKVHIDGFDSNIIQDIFFIVRKLGMKDHVMWSSFKKSDLVTILGLDAKATVIFNVSSTITNSMIDDVATLKTDLNEVYFAPYYAKLDADLGFIDYAHYKNIKIMTYAVDEETKILTYINAGIDGICTNGTNVAKVMINN